MDIIVIMGIIRFLVETLLYLAGVALLVAITIKILR